MFIFMQSLIPDVSMGGCVCGLLLHGWDLADGGGGTLGGRGSHPITLVYFNDSFGSFNVCHFHLNVKSMINVTFCLVFYWVVSD